MNARFIKTMIDNPAVIYHEPEVENRNIVKLDKLLPITPGGNKSKSIMINRYYSNKR